MGRPFRGTIIGAVLGLVAIGIWAATFDPHGGREYSSYLFPVARLVLEKIFPQQSVPPIAFFGGAWLQWLLLGIIIDVVRRIAFVRKQSGESRRKR